jgi:hypothetical protein
MLGPTSCELLTLSIKDLQKMYYEFPHAYSEIIDSAAACLEEELMLKEEALRLMELENAENEDLIKEKIKIKISQMVHPRQTY